MHILQKVFFKHTLTGFKTTSADHSFETTIALAAFNTSYLTTSGLLCATTLTHQTHQLVLWPPK